MAHRRHRPLRHRGSCRAAGRHSGGARERPAGPWRRNDPDRGARGCAARRRRAPPGQRPRRRCRHAGSIGRRRRAGRSRRAPAPRTRRDRLSSPAPRDPVASGLRVRVAWMAALRTMSRRRSPLVPENAFAADRTFCRPPESSSRSMETASAVDSTAEGERWDQARSVSQVYSELNARYAGAANSQATRTAMAAVGGDLPWRVTVASAAPATTAIDNAAYLSSFPNARAVTPVAATADRISATRSDLPFAVPGRRTHAADFAGGAGIVGQWFVIDIGCVSNHDAVLIGANPRSPRAGPARSLQRSQRRVQQLRPAASPSAGMRRSLRHGARCLWRLPTPLTKRQ